MLRPLRLKFIAWFSGGPEPELPGYSLPGIRMAASIYGQSGLRGLLRMSKTNRSPLKLKNGK
jgi:hypothetical protein